MPFRGQPNIFLSGAFNRNAVKYCILQLYARKWHMLGSREEGEHYLYLDAYTLHLGGESAQISHVTGSLSLGCGTGTLC